MPSHDASRPISTRAHLALHQSIGFRFHLKRLRIGRLELLPLARELLFEVEVQAIEVGHLGGDRWLQGELRVELGLDPLRLGRCGKAGG